MEGASAAGEAAVAGHAGAGDLLEDGHLGRAGRVVPEEADLGFARGRVRGGGFEGAAGRHGGGDLAVLEAAVAVVVRVGHAQQEAAVEDGGDLAAEAGAVAGEDGAEADGGALAQEVDGLVDEAAVVVVLERAEEALPAVEEQHHPRR